MVFDMLVLTEEGSTLQAPSPDDLLPLPLTKLFQPKVGCALRIPKLQLTCLPTGR